MSNSFMEGEPWGGVAGADAHWRRIEHTWRVNLFAQDAGFCAARAIWDGDPLRRAELNARVLAGQPKAEIATAMNEPVEVIELYEHWFFSVRHRSTESNWICSCAIGHDLPDDDTVTTVGRFWRRIGYQVGLIALEPLLSAASRQQLAREGLRAYLHPDVPLPTHYKLLIAVECLPVPRTGGELLRLNRLMADPYCTMPSGPADLAGPLLMQIHEMLEPTGTDADPRGTPVEPEFPCGDAQPATSIGQAA